MCSVELLIHPKSLVPNCSSAVIVPEVSLFLPCSQF